MPARAKTAPTDRQVEVLQFVFDYWRQHLTAPSLRDVAAELGLSGTNAAVCHIKPLVKAGLIARAEGGQVARSLVVVGLREAVSESAERFFAELMERLGRGTDE